MARLSRRPAEIPGIDSIEQSHTLIPLTTEIVMCIELLVTMRQRLACCFRRIHSMLAKYSPVDGSIRQANARNHAQLGSYADELE
jgi:hypothetical protein